VDWQVMPVGCVKYGTGKVLLKPGMKRNLLFLILKFQGSKSIIMESLVKKCLHNLERKTVASFAKQM
jgi:hypothetical protein